MVKLPRIRLPDRSRVRVPRFHSNSWLIVCVFVGACIMIATISLRTHEKDQLVTKANSMSSPLLTLCLAGDDTARTLASARTPDGKSLCEAAAEVKTDPVSARTSSLDEARVRELIAVELAKRPAPRATPNMAQVIEAARTVILANPELFRGDPGEPASPVQIVSAVSTFMRANPDMFRGRDGQDGERGSSGRPGDSFGGISGFRLSGGRCVAVVSVITPTGRRQETPTVPMNLCNESTPTTATVTVTATPTPTPTPTTPPSSANSVTPTASSSLDSPETPTGGG